MKKTILSLCLTCCTAFAFTGCELSSTDKPSVGEQNQTAYVYQASENAVNFYNVTEIEEVVCGTYVDKANLPGMPAEDCTGATKIEYHSTSYQRGRYDKLYVQLNYSTTELEELKSEYKSAKFYIYFETVDGVDIIYQNGASHVLSFVEFFNSGWNNNQVHKKTWSTYEIYLSDLIASMNTEETSSDNVTAYLFAGYFSNGHEILNRSMNVYISDITLIKK